MASSRKAAGDLVTSFWARSALANMKSATKKLKTNLSDTHRWKILTGDMVEVTQGVHTGQRGKVLNVIRSNNRLIIDNVNVRLRHVVKRDGVDAEPVKEAVSKPCSVHYSNVALIDPTTDKPTKVARRFLEDGTKVRVSRSSGHVIPKPQNVLGREAQRSPVAGPRDTAAKDVFEVTFPDYEKYLSLIYKTPVTSSSKSD